MRALRIGVASIALSLFLTTPTFAKSVTVTDTQQVGNVIGTAEITLGTNKAGESGRLALGASHKTADGSTPPQGDSLKILMPKGSKINKQVAETCDMAELVDTGSCPSDAYLGKGDADIWVNTGGLGVLDATATVYRIPPVSGGDLIGIAVHAVEPTTGTVANIKMRVFKEGGRTVVLAEDFALPTILGIEPILIRANFNIDASRTFKKKIRIKKRGKKRFKKKRVKQYILTNPSRCKKSWRSDWERPFRGGDVVTHAMDIPCKKGRRRKRSKRR